ncbi:MAG: type II secretion system F family protein [Victivallaceae bacterium]
MALYKYKAIDAAGKTASILIDGDSPDDALSRLRARGLLPLESFGQVGGPSRNPFKRDGFDVYRFTNRLAPLLSAGIRLEKALAVMAGHNADRANQEVIESLRKGLHEGKKFSALVRGQEPRFPKIYASLIEAGEETGNMDGAVRELRRFMAESKEQRDFLITSSIYPLTILAVTFGVIVLMFTVFIPRFSQIFLDMGKELPLPTAIMLFVSRMFTLLWPLWLLLVGGVMYAAVLVRRGGRARRRWDTLVLRTPILGKLVATIEIGRMTRTLAIMLESHVALLDSVRIAFKVLGNSVIAESFSGVATELRAGNPLSKALHHSKYMPDEAVQMIEVGEQSGEVGRMLAEAATGLENESRQGIKRLLALFEPAVIVVLALVILMVVVSIFLAVMEMNQIK